MRDTYGLVPPHIKINYDREEMVDRQARAAKSLDMALRAKDERLSCVLATHRADPESGVKPGYWHVRRRNDPPFPDSYMPIETPDGGFCEPHFGVLDQLDRRDLWNNPLPLTKNDPSARREFLDKERDQLAEELAHELRAGARVAGDGGLTKRLWGRGKPMKGVAGS